MENKAAPAWKKVYSFKTDLNRGRIGELAMLHASNGTLDPLDGRQADMRITKSSKTVELKTDFYDHGNTQNFFMEYGSHGKKLGGPWRSLEEGTDYFIYAFPNPGFVYIFETTVLVDRLNLLKNEFPLTEVFNVGYTTTGYKIPRKLILDLDIEPAKVGIEVDMQKYVDFINWNKAEP